MAACAVCGAEQSPRARFCADCGTPLAFVCPGCGEPSESGKRFCAQCGTALGDPGPAAGGVPRAEAAPSEPVSERRVCSVLFCDLVGFTPFSEVRDPEEVREMLSRYFEVARQIVQRYGGRVEKFIGDAVMAVWGTPVADEEDTERAVRAALEVVDAVARLGEEVGAPGLRARGGVVTGEVAVTIGAEGQGMVAGDAVNTASRVQSSAEAGSVLCDEQTRRLSADSIRFEDAGSVQLKGKEVPVHLFRAVRVLSGVGGKERSGGLEAPFTGRDTELRTLKDLFHASAERRTPRLVVISGPAGVGKTRLGFEFYKYIDGIADAVLWHRGRCLSYGDGVAFWALAEIVRQRFGIAEEDPVDVAEAKLAEGLVRFVEDAQEREYVGTRLSRLLGVPYGSGPTAVLSTEELFAGWRVFFERLAQVAPVVMLIEDAQYADDGLLGFFEHLIDWTRDLAMFVVLFARPGHEAIDSGYGVGRNRSTLSLDPLDDGSMAALVDSLVPGMPARSRDAIVARAQGIPLFAVETVRSLIDTGVVQREPDGYRLAGDLGPLSVPDSLHALLAARLDALPADVRALVADASVVGTSFPKDALVAVSGRDATSVDDALAELVRRDVLQVSADSLSPERGAYRFSQEMLRQVAYETLSKKDRKTRHLAAAEHLRRVFAGDGEEIADVIAQHYLDAVVAAPNDDDVEEITTDAASFLVRAGERAARSGASGRAAESFAEAARISSGHDAASLFERASQAASETGDLDGAMEHAAAARVRLADLGDVRGAARALSLEGWTLQVIGRHGEARTALTDAVAVLRPEPDRDTVEALANLASLDIFGGNLEAGRGTATEALDLAQALDVDDRLVARVLTISAIGASMEDRKIESAALLREAVKYGERAGDAGLTARALLNLADVLVPFDVREGVEVARAAVVSAGRVGPRIHLAARANLMVGLVDIGAWQEARSVAAEVEDISALATSSVPFVDGVLWGLRGERAKVDAAIDTVRGVRESGNVQSQAAMGVLETFAALCAGDDAGALAAAEGVLDKCNALGIAAETQRWAWPLAIRAARRLHDAVARDRLLAMLDTIPYGHVPPVLRADRELSIALRDLEEGDAGAFAKLEGAVTSLRQVGIPYELGHGLCDFAEAVVRAGGDAATVQAELEEAIGIADRLECPPLRARAEDVLGAGLRRTAQLQS